jgi:hypothetical protein
MWVDKQNNIVTNSIIIELNNITLNILYPQLLASHNLWVGNWYRFEWQRVFLMVVTGRIIEQTIVLCYLVLFSSIYIVRFIVIMDTGQWYLTRSMLKDGLWKHNDWKILSKKSANASRRLAGADILDSSWTAFAPCSIATTNLSRRGCGPCARVQRQKTEGSELHKPGFGKFVTLVLFLRM